jgi:uncharacterized protein with FMN-binding domain
MKQKPVRRPGFWIKVSILIVVFILAVVVMINLPKHQHVSDLSFDLTSLADGTYQGECNNGLVFVKVEVDVQNNAIAGVRILEHRTGMGKAAGRIVDSVTSSQSIEVDTVSGATLSSQTILKAIENALSE